MAPGRRGPLPKTCPSGQQRRGMWVTAGVAQRGHVWRNKLGANPGQGRPGPGQARLADNNFTRRGTALVTPRKVVLQGTTEAQHCSGRCLHAVVQPLAAVKRARRTSGLPIPNLVSAPSRHAPSSATSRSSPLGWQSRAFRAALSFCRKKAATHGRCRRMQRRAQARQGAGTLAATAHAHPAMRPHTLSTQAQRHRAHCRVSGPLPSRTRPLSRTPHPLTPSCCSAQCPPGAPAPSAS